MTPSEYFETLKDAKQSLTNKELKESYGVILKLAEKYNKTGQTKSLQRLKFLAEVLGEEEKLIPLGVTTFIYRQTVEDYIDNVADEVVKIIELKNYLREIPDEIAEVVEKTKDIFSEFYVVFTDYTGREERRVALEKRDKDPILFGCFKDNTFVADRFYFLGDWEDAWCDLTLDKLISQYKTKKNIDPTHKIETPQSSEELVELLGKYEVIKSTENEDRFKLGYGESKKPSFFKRIRSIFKKE